MKDSFQAFEPQGVSDIACGLVSIGVGAWSIQARVALMCISRLPLCAGMLTAFDLAQHSSGCSAQNRLSVHELLAVAYNRDHVDAV